MADRTEEVLLCLAGLRAGRDGLGEGAARLLEGETKPALVAEWVTRLVYG